MRLIDADKLEQYMSKKMEEVAAKDNPSEIFVAECLTWNIARCAVKDAPTVDTEPVRYGEWIQDWVLEKGWEDNSEIPFIHCSACEHKEWHYDTELCGPEETPNYCPNCGAKMQ